MYAFPNSGPLFPIEAVATEKLQPRHRLRCVEVKGSGNGAGPSGQTGLSCVLHCRHGRVDAQNSIPASQILELSEMSR